jgi:hypothetical protein
MSKKIHEKNSFNVIHWTLLKKTQKTGKSKKKISSIFPNGFSGFVHAPDSVKIVKK